MKQKFIMGVCGVLFCLILISCGGNGGGSSGGRASTYSISGTVNGDIKQNVNIAVSGATSANVLTDADGNYSVSGLPNGSYTVIPSKAGYTFAQASRSVVINGAASTGNDFTAAAVPYTVSGTVNGTVTDGVTISLSGTTEGGIPFSASVTTAGGGYSISNVPNGSYTVVPAKLGYSFSPTSAAVTVNAANASIGAFTSTVDISVKFNLTGTVSGDIRQGVTVSVTGPANGSAATGPDGSYSVANLPNGTYTVTTSKPGYTFGTGLSATIDSADSSGNDFTAVAVLYSLSGTVSGDVTAGVTITVTGTTEGGAAVGPVETTTSADGSFSVPNIANGAYTVSPAKLGYLFNPASLSVTITAGNSTGVDFNASVNTMLLRANGGTGTAGTGGDGGQLYAESYGSIEVLKTGTVDASFTAPTTPNPGAQAFTVIAPTLVPNTDDSPGALCQVSGGDGSLYIGDGDGACGDSSDAKVTDLTVAAGVTLTLVDESSGYGSLRLANNLVVNGTITTDLTKDDGLQIEANLIDVEGTGKITASATTTDFAGGEIDLGSYPNTSTNTIINRGTIEAKGDGSGAGGYIYFEPNDIVVNYGTIDVSGGNNGGGGGEFDAYVDHGNFYSSGTVRMNGGNGTDGGNPEPLYGNSCWIETACIDNAAGSGDIIISGTWEAAGGDGTSGNGGSGGYMVFETDGIGTVTLNASMSVKGGNGAGAGGAAGEIDIASLFDPYGSGGFTDPTPGKISIAGKYDLRGGDGAQDGGWGGYLAVFCENGVSDGVNASGVGSDVEFVGFPVIILNGGQGGQSGGNASGGSASGGYASDSSLELYTLGLANPAKSITNEADVQARGGNATLTGGYGGYGGYVDLEAGLPPALADASTVLSNTGNVDVSGGGGDSGGDAGEIDMGAQHIDNSGSLTADGGDGTTAGGNGEYIYLTSDVATPTANTGTLSVDGGVPGGATGATIIQ